MRSERKIWKVGGFVAGNVNSVTSSKVQKTNGKVVAAAAGDDGSGLTRIVVWGRGHYTPTDHSENGLVMIRHLIDGTKLDLS